MDRYFYSIEDCGNTKEIYMRELDVQDINSSTPCGNYWFER